ncbi:serine hydrolase domain-containing protein [Maribacter algicola]|uniref:Serine hydrolase domain-containing protein n=1 Tax=Meishania litoralis TaxID=3434685 RepID=A0ACC7LNI6_9FLAO
MNRFKIVLGSVLMLLLLVVLMTSSATRSNSTNDADSKTETFKAKKRAMVAEHERVFEKRKVELRKAVTAYFENALKSGDIIGVGVSIVNGDSILLSEGFGKRNINGRDKVDGKTIFRLGSLSKGFTGVLAANLIEEDKLNWNDKVSDYLPQFRLGDRKNTDKVQLGHILSHTSGTPYHSFTNLVEAGLPMGKIAGRFNEVKPISEPGKMYSYQNAMFALSSEIMKKVTGKEIGALLKQRFFEPLGMHTANTSYPTLVKYKNIATPHSRRRTGWQPKRLTDHYDNAVAAGGINASALDMAKWMRFLLGHNPEVMDKNVISEAFTPQVEINIGRKYYKRWPGHVSSHYAYGWRIHKFEDETAQNQITMWHHGGSVNNFRNEIAIYPDHDFGICVLMNSNSRLASTVIPDLQKIIENIYAEQSVQSAGSLAEAASANLR